MSRHKANIYEVVEYYKNHTKEDTARKFGISTTTVTKYCRRAGFQKFEKLSHNTERFSEDTLSLEECYWLGFLFADGFIRMSPGGMPNGVGIKLNGSDHKHLLLFKKFMGFDGQVSKLRDGNSILSITMNVDNLISLGVVPNKTFEGFVPTHALKTEEQRVCWVLGFFDGDGSISSSHDRRASFYCQLEPVLEFVKDVTGTKNEPKIHRNDATYYSLRLSTAESVMFLKRAYITSPVCLQRKLAIFLECLHKG